MLLCQCAFALDIGGEEQAFIAAAANEEQQPPAKGRNLFFDNFSDTTLNSRWDTSLNSGGTVGVEDGRLTLKRTSGTSSEYNRVYGYFKEDKSSLSGGMFGLSFDIYRSNTAKRCQVQLQGNGSSPFTTISWQNGTFQSCYTESKGTQGTSAANTVGTTYTGNKIHVDYLFDLTEGCFSLWLDGEQVLQNKYPRQANLTKLDRIYCLMEAASNGQTMQLDNVHLYEPAKRTLWKDAFEGTDIDTVHWAAEPTSALAQNDGYLALTHSSGSATKLFGYFNEDKSTLKGKVGVSFALRRADKTKQVQAQSQGAGNQPFFALQWNNGGGITIGYADTAGGGNKWHSNVATIDTNQIYVDCLFDLEADAFTLWIDGKEIVAKGYSRTANLKTLTRFYFYMENAHTTTASITDWHVYTDEEAPEPVVTDEEVLAQDKELLTQDSLLKVPMLESGLLVDSLELPMRGENGTAIVWESGNPDIIGTDGTVNRPAEDTEVQLTAKMTYGEASDDKVFTFRVAGTKTDIAGIPPVGRMLHENRFDGSAFDERIVPTATGGTVTQANGKANITRTATTTGTTILDYYMNADKSPATGMLVTEFILNRAATQKTMIAVRGQSGDYMTIAWNANTTVDANYSDTQGQDGGWHNGLGDGFKAKDKLKVTAQFCTDDQTMTLWLNNQLVVEKAYPRVKSVEELQYIRVYLENAGATTLTMDDFRHYRVIPDMPDEERVQKDAERLTYEKLIKPAEVMEGVIASNISLPTFGTYGSDIVWTSSHPDIIAADGTVTRPGEPYQTNPEVTLTATVSAGEVSRQVTLKVKVLLAKVNLNEGIGIGEIIYQNDFSQSALDGHIAASTAGGSVACADGALKVTRSSNDQSATIADIYAQENHEAVQGAIGVEYTVERTEAKVVQMRLRISGSDDYIALTWGANGTFSIMCRDTENGGVVTKSTKAYSGKLHIKAFLNTEESQFTLWLNDDEVLSNKYSRVAGKQLQYIRIYLESTNYTTVSVDDFKVYYATLPPIDRIKYDLQWLTEQQLLSEPYVADKTINADLNLMAKGRYGSNITWSSSAPDIIAENGKVTRPVDVSKNPEVELTATLNADGIEATKTFRFFVLRDFSSDSARLDAELAELGTERLTDEESDKITCSLNLPTEGLYIGNISWKSSDTTAITNGGRVIRPRSDQPAKEVTMTAIVKSGSVTKEKELKFTVLPDEKYTDPDYMTDEEFFGEWDGEKWTTQGKLDYTRSDLRGVEEFAKQGNYDRAKEELLKHMRSRNVKLPIGLSARDPGWVDMVLDDIHHLQGNKYYQGETTVSSEDYTMSVISVKPSAIAKGGTNTYSIIARYNEISSLLIASKEHPNPQYRPKLILTVNGQDKTYEVDADATIRAGSNKTKNYGQEPELEATMFGELLGDTTSRALLRFQISDLLESDAVTKARLVLYTKVTPAFVGKKSVVVLYEPTNTWKEETVNWNTLTGYVYNFNGIAGANHWNGVSGCDVEYTYQSPRFLCWSQAAAEYAYTKDEKYAYKMLRQMMDFIWDKGGPIDYSKVSGVGQGWPRNGALRGGWPRTLDTAERLRRWATTLDTLVDSKYMTPEICTAIMKNIWDMTDNMTLSTSSSGNWVQNEQMSVIESALSMPEFTKAEEWIAFGSRRNEELIYLNNFADGSYKEATGGYNMGAYGTFLDYKRLMIENGRSVSAEFDDMLQKAAYYNLLLRGSGGQNLQYGDESAGKSVYQRYPQLPLWYGDHEIEYIDSFGSKGIKPTWTSRQFKDSGTTMMRADWSLESPYLYTNVRGGGAHGHQDDNSIIAIAYDRILLNDSGIFTYTESDPYRKWGKSVRAHNTVEISGQTQSNSGNVGTIHDWVTNDSYDFLSQSTKSYSNYDHRRSITFLKPNIWIVSDLVQPKDATKENSYKQIWHMLPTANLKTDAEEKTIYSNFATGANIIVASADQDVVVTEEDGWYDYGYQQLTDAKFAYFEKNNVKGAASYDTVLIPYRTKGASADVQRIDIGVPTQQATALKFDSTVDGEKATTYYLLDYAYDGSGRTMEQYRTNAKLTVVRTDEKGAVKEFVLNQGSKITGANGTVLVDTGEPIEDLSMEVVGGIVQLSSSKESLENVKINVSGTVRAVMVNGTSIAFQKDGDTVTVGATEKPYDPPKDANANKGGVAGSAGGAGGGGGNQGTVTTPTPTAPPTAPPITTPTPTHGGTPQSPEFQDTTEHWAKDYIQDLKEKDIIHGDGTGIFRPDDTVTRAEFTAMVVRAMGLQEDTTANIFEDVAADDWYSGAVGAAVKAKIISPDRQFRPEDSITREEISKVIAAACTLLQAPAEIPQDYQISYEDSNLISEWAIKYVREISYLGLMNGRTQQSFDPLGNATRAEMATVVSRMLQ